MHSNDPETGGVLEAAKMLSSELNELGFESELCFDRHLKDNQTLTVAHGLWQWPGSLARKIYKRKGIPYIIFPHGMLDPWFKEKYPIKHIKKQVYWWLKQGKIIKQAKTVCYTTEEERRLAQSTFWPYCCEEKVTGLGVRNPPNPISSEQLLTKKFPQLRGKRILLYLGRLHPKKGLDMLLRSFSGMSDENDCLIIAGPLNAKDPFQQSLLAESSNKANILWTGMLKGSLKWQALKQAEALILPSHQENFGMVVAEALSVGTPVFITDKVNLWREVESYGAGLVAKDNQEGIDHLVRSWKENRHDKMPSAALYCFEQRLHIRNTASKIIGIMQSLDIKGN